MEIRLDMIGRIRSPHTEPVGTPIQPAFAEGVKGEVVIEPAFVEGLDDIEGFERLWLIYLLDRIAMTKLKVVPYRDTRERGVFATRAPCRPNPIGMSAVRLSRREGNVLHVLDVDVLDGTPLLDVKPYIPEYDSHPMCRSGWMDADPLSRAVADGRFHGLADLEPKPV
ncbi:MAG: tRNA (N6-threonylcarbamoyladenosine(37)-N6)-methyltransferase TrmO [Polyangiaceae bacterium]